MEEEKVKKKEEEAWRRAEEESEAAREATHVAKVQERKAEEEANMNLEE